MTQMTKAQRNAILEAHNYRVEHPNHLRDGHVRAQSGARNQMIMRMIQARLLDEAGRVTLSALRAAGVNIDAIHAEAEMVDAAAEQASPRGRRFHAAVLQGKSYRAALDLLHDEASAEGRARTAVANGTARKAMSALAPQGIAKGSIVVRRGEESGPRGEIVEIEAGWGHAWVIFAGLLPSVRVRLSMLSLAPLTTERDCTHGDGCPVHPDVRALHNFDELQRDEARPQVGALLDLAEIRGILNSGQAPEAIALQLAVICCGAGGALDRIERVLRSA